jgi:hypothetical protein
MSLDPMEECDRERIAEQESVMALVRRGVQPIDPSDWQRHRIAEREAQSARLRAEHPSIYGDPSKTATIADVIAESVNNENASVVEYELRVRHSGGWEMPESDADRRALLIQILTGERNTKRGMEC